MRALAMAVLRVAYNVLCDPTQVGAVLDILLEAVEADRPLDAV